MVRSSLRIMFEIFSIVLMAHMDLMKLVEASSNRMLSQAADQNGVVLPCPSQCPHNQTYPVCCNCDPTKGSCKRCCKSSPEGPLIASNTRSLFPAAAPDGIVLPCPSQCPHNKTHPVCCECDPSKGSCKTCCKSSPEGPLIIINKHPLFPAAALNGIVLPCPSQCPHNKTHPVCCECDPTKGSCKTCCKIPMN